MFHPSGIHLCRLMTLGKGYCGYDEEGDSRQRRRVRDPPDYDGHHGGGHEEEEELDDEGYDRDADYQEEQQQKQAHDIGSKLENLRRKHNQSQE